MRHIQDISIALAVGMLLSHVFAGCSTPPVNASANVPVASPQSPTSQNSQSGDQKQSGNNNTAVGGGNSFRLDGGTIAAISVVVAPCVVVCLVSLALLKKGYRCSITRFNKKRLGK